MTVASHQDLLDLIAKRKASVSRQKTIKPKTGRNRYRLLPGWKTDLGDPRFFLDFGQHFIKDAAGAVKAVYVCVDKTFGRPCQVCDNVAQGIMNSADDATKKRLEDAASSARVLVNALELDGPTPTVPQILELAPSCFNGKKGVGGILGLFSEWPTMLDPNVGHDIIIERSGTGFDTAYGVQIAGGSKPVPADAMTKLHDLDKFVAVESEEAMRRALTSVQAISGLLPAPATGIGTGGDRPSTPVPAMLPAPAPVATMPAPVAMAPVAAAAPVAAPQPVAAPVAAPQPVAAPVAVAAAVAAPVAASTGDAELDKLLADLG